MSTPSENVQHGLKSWVDYDRPWLFRMFFSLNIRYHEMLSVIEQSGSSLSQNTELQ